MSDNTPQAPGRTRGRSQLPSSEGGNTTSPVGSGQAAEVRKSSGLVRRLKPVVLRSAVSVLLIAGSLAVCGALGRGSPPPTVEAVAAPTPVVEVLAVQQHAGGIDFEVDGVVIPFQQVEVPAEVVGRIASRSGNCRIGRTVKQGELLLSVDPQDYELEVRRCDEQLRQAQAELHEWEVETRGCERQIVLAKEDLAIKQREVQRYEKTNDPAVYSRSEVDTVRLKELQSRDAVQTELDKLELLQARKQRLESGCGLSKAQLQKARLDLGRTEVRSPIAGVITREPLERGVYVQRGGTVAVVQDTSCMEIRCSLHIHEMRWLWQSGPGQRTSSAPTDAYHIPKTPATVSFVVGGTTYRWRGSLSYFDGGQVDKQTRMIPCRVYVRKPLEFEIDGVGQGGRDAASIALMAGMFVKVTVHARPDLPLVEIPEASIQPGNTVWTVVQDGSADQLHRVPIRVAQSLGTAVLVYTDVAGLTPGDLVVTSPLAAPVEGGSVELMEEK